MDKYTAEHILKLEGKYDTRALKTAYRALAATYHPDAAEVHGISRDAATVKMQEINAANDYLEKILDDWGPMLTCEKQPAPPDSPEARGFTWAPPAPKANATYNPFEGSRPDGTTARARRRTSTAEYYWADPRFQTNAANARRHAETAGQREPRYYNGEYESFSQKPQPEPKEDPTRPFPKWYLPLWRLFAIFPYRFVFLFAVCLLVNVSDPFGTSAHLGFVSFEDMLILLALVNLVKPFLTSPIRAAFLWVLDRACNLAWHLQR